MGARFRPEKDPERPKRHYFSKRYSMAAHMQETQGTAAAMTDTAAEAESSRLGSALVELEADGVSYGSITCTVTLHGDYHQIDQLDAEVRRIFNTYDAKVIREGLRPTPRLVLPPARPAARAQRPQRLCLRRAVLLPGSDLRIFGRQTHQQTLAAGRPWPCWKPGARPPTTMTCSPATWVIR